MLNRKNKKEHLCPIQSFDKKFIFLEQQQKISLNLIMWSTFVAAIRDFPLINYNSLDLNKTFTLRNSLLFSFFEKCHFLSKCHDKLSESLLQRHVLTRWLSVKRELSLHYNGSSSPPLNALCHFKEEFLFWTIFTDRARL